MKYTNIKTPLGSKVCYTCIYWGGARVLQNGFLYTKPSFSGPCNKCSGSCAHGSHFKSHMLAVNTDCTDWAEMSKSTSVASF